MFLLDIIYKIDYSCTSIRTEGLDLYGGTKHMVAIALGQVLSQRGAPATPQTRLLTGISSLKKTSMLR